MEDRDWIMKQFEDQPLESQKIPARRPRAVRGDSRTVNWLTAMMAVYLAKQIFGIEITVAQATEFIQHLPPIDDVVDGIIVVGGGLLGIRYRLKARSRLDL